jgi:hypothetical protein
MKKKKDNWKPGEWQGRSKKNVCEAYKVNGAVIIFFFIMLMIALFLNSL